MDKVQNVKPKKCNLKPLKKLKIWSYVDDKKLLRLKNIEENSFEEFNKVDVKMPVRFDYVEKRESDRSTLVWTGNNIFFFQTSWKDGFSKKIALEYDLSCIIGKDNISFSRKYDFAPQAKNER